MRARLRRLRTLTWSRLPDRTKRRALIWLATAGLVALFAVGFAGFTLSTVVRGQLLRPGFYADALAENHVYDRVYGDVLADPEVADIATRFLGDVEMARSYTVSTMRLVLPPETLRQGTERALRELTDYLNGETREIESGVPVSELIGNQSPAIAEYVRQQLIGMDAEVSGSPEEFERELSNFLREFSSGRRPEKLPVYFVSPESAGTLAALILEHADRDASEAIRTQIIANLSENDVRGALALAAPLFTETRAEAARRNIDAAHGGENSVDPVDTLARLADESSEAVLSELNGIRRLVAVFVPEWLPLASATLMVVSLGLLLLLHSRSAHDELRVGGFLLAGVGVGFTAVAWLFGPELVDVTLGRPLDAALTPPPEGWDIPGSVRLLIQDVYSSLQSEVVSTLRLSGLVLLVPGLAAIAFSYVRASATVRAHMHPTRRKAIAAGALTAVLALALGVAVATFTSPASASGSACNGYIELCERPYDEVVFPATHNSMATASEGWAFPAQDHGISRQLEDGVRALLIDTHYWEDARTAADAIADRNDLSRQTRQALIGALGTPGAAPDGAYLCHATCWLGATPLEGALGEIRDFMKSRPREVVTLIIQDAISVEDTVSAFEGSGLTDYVYAHEPGQEWPTLGEMIEDDKRLVVMAENSGPPPAWHHHAWDLAQDTPYTFRRASEFICAPNRGGADNPLFLMNHWITSAAPDRVNANRVNQYDVLLERSRECEEARGQVPNFIAVDFYQLGGLFEVVDQLNDLNVRTAVD